MASVLSFDASVSQAQQFQAFDFLRELNLNDHLITPFYQIMWIVILFLVPGVTMGLFASEKTNGTQELLMTSPITVWELVLGKFLAAAALITLLTLQLALMTGILFLFGEPEPAKTGAGLLAMWLIGLTYAAVGCLASSVTRNQLIAFFLALVLLLVLWLIGVVADLGAVGGAAETGSAASDLLRWLSSSGHFEGLLSGLVDTRDLAYFAFMIGAFLVLTKMAVESVRWR
jgi:ABC-2 type transport system permease protein